jgi:hypothetical protein
MTRERSSCGWEGSVPSVGFMRLATQVGVMDQGPVARLLADERAVWVPPRQVSEDLLACLLRMMMAVRDHRGAAAGPVKHEDLVTCLYLAPLPSALRVKHPSWLSPREFPSLKPQSREQFLHMDICSCFPDPDHALVHRVAERLGLPALDEPLVKALLSVLWLVRPGLRGPLESLC